MMRIGTVLRRCAAPSTALHEPFYAKAGLGSSPPWAMCMAGVLTISCASSTNAPQPQAASPGTVLPGHAATADGGSAGAQGSNAARAAVPPLSGRNLIRNGTFDGPGSLPWIGLVLPPAAADSEVAKGAFCTTISKPGEHRWDIQLRYRELAIQKGHTYAIQYKAQASRPAKAHVKVGMAGPPYKEHWADDIELGIEPRQFSGTFTMTAGDDPAAEFAFHFGADLIAGPLPVVACIDDLVLDDPAFGGFAADDEEKPKSPIRVNQYGYVPGFPKNATIHHDSKEPLDWTLVDPAGVKIASGKTAVFGDDASSGDHVHAIDFSSAKGVGKDLRLVVGKQQSQPFAMAPDLYKKLKYDALAYFYQSRSGIAIDMPYAMDPKWARKAGHLSDSKTPCAPDSGCDYALDVSGGWYDAGDYGKYVVNAGVSVWTLLNLWERTKAAGKSAAAFGDGKMLIPENKNRVPDLLDETRWEIEWMLKMQVPTGHPLAGMAHHKMHDKEWTALGHAPADDPMPRFLQPPTTAATLNLAAAAAQAARVYRDIDSKFAARCLEAAERAWSAAQANPNRLATNFRTAGGGPYADTNVSDEFYWAAAELFVTTGKDVYKTHVLQSPHFREPLLTADGDGTSFTWQRTFALGTISLALIPNKLSPAERAIARESVIKAADGYLAIQQKEGYGQPFPGAKPYHWGSNSFILNNLLVLGLAGDLTRDPKYARGVASGIDYILGRNPLDQSYVTGYGSRPVRHPHHRFWAPRANPALPPAPPGIVAGGPNSVLQDPYVKAAGLKGCAPAKCYVDHLEAPSVNEVAINWNAPLAWVAAWLDEKATVSK